VNKRKIIVNKLSTQFNVHRDEGKNASPRQMAKFSPINFPRRDFERFIKSCVANERGEENVKVRVAGAQRTGQQQKVSVLSKLEKRE
jgi:hypothetical protein